MKNGKSVGKKGEAVTVGSETKAVADRDRSIGTGIERSGKVGNEVGTSVMGVNGARGVADGNGVVDK